MIWSRLFSKKNPGEIKFHPEYKMPIKYAFTIGKKDYYQCVNDYEMPVKRFAFASKFYGEMQNRITTETLRDFIEAGKDAVNKGELGKSYKLWEELEYRADWLFEPESLLRCASVLFFDLGEALDDYDFEYNAVKIKLFEKKKMYGLFLKVLLSDQKKPLHLSGEDLQTYLDTIRSVIAEQRKFISVKGDSNSK